MLFGLLYIHHTSNEGLTFSDAEHLCATGRANTLSSGFAILHSDGFSIFHLFLGSAFYTISLHDFTSFL
jgi:hypothetical protein